MQVSTTVFVTISFLLASLTSRASAQTSQPTTPAEVDKAGTIVHIEGSNVFVDLGAYDQLALGTRVELFEVITIQDPKTYATATSAFPIGEGSVRLLGANLCTIAVSEHLLKRLKVGDQVKPQSQMPPQQRIDPWIVKPPPPPKAMTQQEFKLLVELIEGTLGKSLPEQIRGFEDWVLDNEVSPVANDVEQELDWLLMLRKQEQAVQQRIAEQNAQHTRQLMKPLEALDTELDVNQPMAVRNPEQTLEGQYIHLAFIVLEPKDIEEAWIYYRKAGESQYQRRVLIKQGDAYRHGVIPAEVVREPGVEYFVEASSAKGTPPKAILGSLDRPKRIAVQEKIDEPNRKEKGPRSQISIRADYVDFDGFSQDNDQYRQVEVDVLYRFYGLIHAMRIGFGSLSGKSNAGGEKSYNADYSYLYTELEFPLSAAISFMLRPQMGTVESKAEQSESCAQDSEAHCQRSNSLGLRARLRIGQHDHTHLIFGFDSSKSLGALYEFLFNWPVIPQWPVQFVAQVTDQPVEGDYGLRLMIEVGWRAVPWVYPSLRLSAQGRDVEKSGISGGLGLNFIW